MECENCEALADLVEACHGWALADEALSAKASECEELMATNAALTTMLGELRAHCTQQMKPGPVYGCALCGGAEDDPCTHAEAAERRAVIHGIPHFDTCFIAEEGEKIDNLLRARAALAGDGAPYIVDPGPDPRTVFVLNDAGERVTAAEFAKCIDPRPSGKGKIVTYHKDNLAGDGAGEGRAHEWVDAYKSIRGPLCLVCGIMKRADGQNKPCKGPARIGLRGDDDPYAKEMPPEACGTFKNIPEVPCVCSKAPGGKRRDWRVHLSGACYPTIEDWKAAKNNERGGEA